MISCSTTGSSIKTGGYANIGGAPERGMIEVLWVMHFIKL